MIFFAIENENDRNRIENIYFKNRRLMYLTAFDILKNKELAEDAVHNAFIKIIDLIDNTEGRSPEEVRSYVILICRSVSLNMLKRKNNGLEKEIEYEKKRRKDSEIPPEEVLLNTEILEFLIKAIGELKPIYKEIFLLRYAHGLMPRDIAKILETNEETIKKRLLRAKAQITEKFEKEAII